MNWRTDYIAVDWGTTNRRAWRIAADGQIAASLADDLGLMAVPARGFPAAAKEIRQRLGDHPMILAGMVGSNRGWRDAGYVSCPADADALAAAIAWIEPGRTGIVPGVCQNGDAPDVMRGEEVQVLGAIALGLAPPEGLVCHPGTHAKWIQLQSGRIAQFRTMMTGELFNLLKTHSILSPQLQGEVIPDAGFAAGLAAAFQGTDILSGLFGIRARHLLGKSIGEQASFASGLLIGCDVGAALAIDDVSDRQVVLIGRPDLCALYEAALAARSVSARQVDGAEAFLAGIRLITEKL